MVHRIRSAGEWPGVEDAPVLGRLVRPRHEAHHAARVLHTLRHRVVDVGVHPAVDVHPAGDAPCSQVLPNADDLHSE